MNILTSHLYDSVYRVNLSGTATVGSTIFIDAGNETVSSAEVGSDGTWSVGVFLSTGNYQLTTTEKFLDRTLGPPSEPQNVQLDEFSSGNGITELTFQNVRDITDATSSSFSFLNYESKVGVFRSNDDAQQSVIFNIETNLNITKQRGLLNPMVQNSGNVYFSTTSNLSSSDTDSKLDAYMFNNGGFTLLGNTLSKLSNSHYPTSATSSIYDVMGIGSDLNGNAIFRVFDESGVIAKANYRGSYTTVYWDDYYLAQPSQNSLRLPSGQYFYNDVIKTATVDASGKYLNVTYGVSHVEFIALTIDLSTNLVMNEEGWGDSSSFTFRQSTSSNGLSHSYLEVPSWYGHENNVMDFLKQSDLVYKSGSSTVLVDTGLIPYQELSSDGKYIYYIKLDVSDSGIFLYNIETGVHTSVGEVSSALNNSDQSILSTFLDYGYPRSIISTEFFVGSSAGDFETLKSDFVVIYPQPWNGNYPAICGPAAGISISQILDFWDTPQNLPVVIMSRSDLPDMTQPQEKYVFDLAKGYRLATSKVDLNADLDSTAILTSSSDAINSGGGADTVYAMGGSDTIDSGSGNDIVFAGSGNDTIVGGSGVGADTYVGGEGLDTLSYAADIQSITIDARLGITSGSNVSDNFSEVENFVTGSGNDTLYASPDGNVMDGGSGNDSLYGGMGDDSFVGGIGNDSIFSGNGNDYVDAGVGDDLIVGGDGAGDDTYVGGAGTDTIKYTSALAGITVNLATGGATSSAGLDAAGIGTDTLTGIENIIAGNFDDNLIGSSAANTITAGLGNDTLDGGIGIDSMVGGLGNDTYYVDSVSDVVVEAIGEGTDSILTSVASFTLNTTALANVENLGVDGPWLDDGGDSPSGANFTLTGNAQGNLIGGSDGVDARRLAELLGDDSSGKDAAFESIQSCWNTTPTLNSSVKTATTFSASYAGGTKIELAGTGFTGTGSHALTITSATVTQQDAYGGTDVTTFTGSISLTSTGSVSGSSISALLGSSISTLTGQVTQSSWTSGYTDLVGFHPDVKVTYVGSWDLMPQTAVGPYQGKQVTNLTSVVINSFNKLPDGPATITAAVTLTANLMEVTDADDIDHHSGSLTSVKLDDGLGNTRTWTGSVAFNEGVIDAIVNNNDDGSTLFDVIPMSPMLGGNDTISGLDGNDLLAGGLGANVVDGGAGTDTLLLRGVQGDYVFSRPTATTVMVTNVALQADGIVETHSISNIENVVFGYTTVAAIGNKSVLLSSLLGNTASSGDDSLTGSDSANYFDGLAGNDTLLGVGGNDTLIGGLGNDSLVGGTGSDSMVGGDGNDIYDVDRWDDIVVELANQGTDTIKTSLSGLSLDSSWGGGVGGGQVENLIYTGSDMFFGDGNALANSITGGIGDDVLWGGAGNDTLMGGDGNDVLDGVVGTDSMVGGFGNDTYYVDSATDVVVEVAAGGTDTILTSVATFTLNTAALANVEDLGVDGPWWNKGDSGDTSGLNFTLTGNTQNNLIEGSNGLDAREFAQVLGRTSGPSESAGFDLIQSYWSQNPLLLPTINAAGTAFSATYDDGTKVELLGTGFTGTGVSHNVTISSAKVTQQDGYATEIREFTGSITVQTAGPGSAMSSPTGKVTQSIWTSGYTDLAGFHPDERVTFAGSWDLSPQTTGTLAGHEVTTITSILVNTFNYDFGLTATTPITSSLAMTGNVTETENASGDSTYSGFITGVTVSDGVAGSTSKSWTGKVAWSESVIDAITNKNLDDSTLFDVIPMSPMLGGNDTISGLDGNDLLAGGLGANVIDGGAGTDTLLLEGLRGDYSFSRPTATTVLVTNVALLAEGIVETHTVSNIERVVFGYTTVAAIGNTSVTLGSLLGNAASPFDDELTGNDSPNSFDGLAGNDTLLGNGGNDTLIGGLGNDSLVGGTGSDSMVGGDGNDTYVVEDALDVVSETNALAAGGIDLVQASLSYVLGSNLENLTLTSTGEINGRGNVLNNTIIGNAGANILDGDAGVDTLTGGGGDDTYIVDLTTLGALQDTVTAEGTNAGTDTLQLRGSALLSTGVTLTLAAELEKFDASATGSTKLNLTGNAAANTLTGNAADNILDGGIGADTLIGGLGNDTLTGGLDSDYFVFNTAANASVNMDTITDFVSGVDHIQFSATIFTGLGTITDQFWSGSGVIAAHDSSDRIIYNSASGALYYDADGTGMIAAVQVALIGVSSHGPLINTDIQIIA